MANVAGVFSQLGLPQWWTISPSQRFGANANGEWGEDFPMAPGSRVGSITGGRVVYVGQPSPGSSIGYVVQVESPDGTLTHYQHLQSATVKEGDTVQPGQVVGLSGGCPTGAYTATGCRWTDANSTGPHIEVRRATGYTPSGGVWYQPWVDPQGQWSALAGDGTMELSATSATGGGDGCAHSISIFPGSSICLDAGIAFGIRAGLVIAGLILILAAVAIFAAGNSGVRTVAADVAPAALA